ncbi:hypothetical protein [Streptomyces sp. cmx-18-6]|uniref:hypothetical protein n=1 Tax=Streptomyces sp. cmx-18-6 TaxID=2790930 RepID=UPI00397F6B45
MVAGLLVALLAVLIAWVVTSAGGGGSKDDAKPGASDPVKSITPGPGSSGPTITQQPGGRDESGDEGSDGSNGDSGDTGGSGGGSDGASGGSASDGTSEGGTGTAGAGSEGTGTGSGGGGTAGQQVPAGSSLPDCKPGAVELTLRTKKVNYAPDDKPKFELVAKNTSSTACKADLGPKNVVLTVTEAGGEDDDVVWSSKDCPTAPGPLFLKVPAGATIVHTVDWNRTRSSPNCATPPATKAGPGTYLLEAKAPDNPVRQASFVLKKD